MQALLSGNLGSAGSLLRDALSEAPFAEEVHLALCFVSLRAGSRAMAVTHLRRALAIHPLCAQYHANLATLQSDAASSSLRRAIAIEPALSDCHSNYAILCERHAFDRILRCKRALASSGDNTEAKVNLSLVLIELGRSGEAVPLLSAATSSRPLDPNLRFSLAGSLADVGKLGDALTEIRRALVLAPGDAGIWLRSARVRCAAGLVPEATTAAVRSIAIGAEDLAAYSNRLMIALYEHSVTPAMILALAQARHRADKRQSLPATRAWRTDAPLRVGYVSADFWGHPIAYSIAPIIAAHDRSRLHVTCYADATHPDSMTAQLAASADRWVDVTGLDGRSLAQRIRHDQIDALVILAGHTARNRLDVARYRSAPLQISMFDVATSGAPEIDGIVVDPVLCPPTAYDGLSERPMLVSCLFCFAVPHDAPPVEAARGGGPLTFGSLCIPAKLGPATAALWSPLLRAVANARLVLKYKNLYADPAVREPIAARFADAGIERSRIQFLAGVEDRGHHLGCYQEIDVALDPTPFNGCTATFEALWMGVPVLTRPTDPMVGRMGASILTAAGLGDLVAESAQEFLERGLKIAGDADRRAMLRRRLRETIRSSRLVDGRLLASELEHILEQARNRSSPQ